ncbi:hypothetical protein B566_EDAN012755 [Ephemera danica]|nr:hypothetical protein B566_EDAN012755 [Ephemera danica]
MTASCVSALMVGLLALLLFVSFDPDSFTVAWSAAAREPWWQSGRTQRLRQGRGGSSPSQTLDPQTIRTAVQFAEMSTARLARLEQTLVNAAVRVVPGSPAHGAHIVSRPTTHDALQKHYQAQLALQASQFIANNNCRKFNLKERRCGTFVNSVSMVGTNLASSCASTTSSNCDRQSKYRSLDGSCNNPKHPSWGAALTSYRRLVPPNYADGLYAPRGGKSLPNPREASVAMVTSDPAVPSQSMVTLATAIWSQFVTMDLAHTPSAMMLHTGSSIACCKLDGSPLSPRSRHPACLPITVDAKTAGRNGRRCLDFVRSIIAPRSDCHFGFAEQMNQATHWLDGSPLYGSNIETSNELREMTGGRLLLSKPGGLLPLANEPTMACQDTKKPTGPCFRAGDLRVNEHPMLTTLVTILAREHNLVAKQLAQQNPHWEDETLFHEARRVVIAEMQHISYKQWLPMLIGENSARELLNAKYSEDIDPSVFNSLSALPFTLSMLPTNLNLHSKARTTNSSLRLRQHYNRPAVVTERMDDLMRSMATQQAHPVDLLHTEDVTNHMYAAEGAVGLDAVSLVIQRGRDHGLPGYNAFRAACGLPRAKTIQDFLDSMDAQTVANFGKMYRSPNDVDLYLGVVAERPKDNKSLLGPTLTCLLSKQFMDTRRADRFFYDVDKEFSTAQLAELRKSNLARIFCDNGDDITHMQPDVFRPPGVVDGNAVLPCDQIPGPNFAAWKASTQVAR